MLLIVGSNLERRVSLIQAFYKDKLLELHLIKNDQ